jgi:hypothetical protein
MFRALRARLVTAEAWDAQGSARILERVILRAAFTKLATNVNMRECDAQTLPESGRLTQPLSTKPQTAPSLSSHG